MAIDGVTRMGGAVEPERFWLVLNGWSVFLRLLKPLA